MKSSKGVIEPVNRYGIADAARTRNTLQMLRNVIKPAQKQLERASAPKSTKAQ